MEGNRMRTNIKTFSITVLFGEQPALKIIISLKIRMMKEKNIRHVPDHGYFFLFSLCRVTLKYYLFFTFRRQPFPLRCFFST